MGEGKKKTETEDAIDANLKKVFEQLSEDPLPDKLQDLLAQLKEQDKKKGTD